MCLSHPHLSCHPVSCPFFCASCPVSCHPVSHSVSCVTPLSHPHPFPPFLALHLFPRLSFSISHVPISCVPISCVTPSLKSPHLSHHPSLMPPHLLHHPVSCITPSLASPRLLHHPVSCIAPSLIPHLSCLFSHTPMSCALSLMSVPSA